MQVKINKRVPKRERPKPGGAVRAIRKDALTLILESAMGAMPNEFAGVLRAYDGVVTEVMVLPGTEQGARAALFHFYMLPADRSVVGTVHSHPSGNYWPSGADLELFDRFGSVHIIVGYPYNLHSWQAYDGRGRAREIQVIGDGQR
jgi:proteasome lid subunit RPN8/RPN11